MPERLPGEADVREVPVEVAGDYLVSTDLGVYRLAGSRLTKLVSLPTFGIAADTDWLYVAGYRSRTTFVMRAPRGAMLDPGAEVPLQCLYESRVVTSGHRIHQIALHRGALWVAETGRNTILCLDPETGRPRAEWAPFQDAFGEPILYDNHHINSLSVLGEAVLFVAYRAGPGSLLGLLHGGRVVGHRWPHPGVHDVHLVGEELLFSDTFGGEAERGALIVNGRPFAPDFFAAPPGYVVRGLAGEHGEWIIGHSHKGSRQKRYEGRAALLVADPSGAVSARAELPFAQFYDVIRTDGGHFETKAATEDPTELRGILARSLGAPVYESAAVRLDDPAGAGA